MRSYIDAHAERGGRITKTEWIEHAQKEKGISRSRAYEIIKEEPVALQAAIREALQLVGETAAQYGALALYASGLKIYQDIMDGQRTTKSLTSTELGIMRECVSSLTPAQMIGFSMTDSRGNTTQGAVAGRRGSSQDDVASQAAQVVQGLRQTMDSVEGGNRNGSDAQSGDGSDVSPDSVQNESSSCDVAQAESDSGPASGDSGCASDVDAVAGEDETVGVGDDLEYPVESSGGEE